MPDYHDDPHYQLSFTVDEAALKAGAAPMLLAMAEIAARPDVEFAGHLSVFRRLDENGEEYAEAVERREKQRALGEEYRQREHDRKAKLAERFGMTLEEFESAERTVRGY